MDPFPIPPKEAILFDDPKLYICLASFPITRGHTIVVWKEKVKDLHLLQREDYEYLMQRVDDARNILLTELGVEKVYLLYMDEIQQVHWHLVPRYNEKGINMLDHAPIETKDFSLAEVLRPRFIAI